jgi:hypothetical protein
MISKTLPSKNEYRLANISLQKNVHVGNIQNSETLEVMIGWQADQHLPIADLDYKTCIGVFTYVINKNESTQKNISTVELL